MHFHLPKPLHGWRELVGEVGIIVIGVLIALGAEQLVEAWHWSKKVEAAKESINFEINDQLDYSEEVVRFGPCTGPYVDALEAAILKDDTVAIGRLHDVRPPFEPRPWRSTAWQSTMSTQVADHLNARELGQYAFMFNSFEDLARGRDQIVTDFAEATVGRLSPTASEAAKNQQLAAAERLRTHLALETSIAETMIDTAAGRGVKGWRPIDRRRWGRLSEKIEEEGRLCERTAKSLHVAKS
jgi:hypothetical protein